MLTRLHPHPGETLTLPPISALTTTYPSAPPPHILPGLQSLQCCGALKLCLRHCPHPPLCLLAPAAYHPYACEVPSLHAYEVAYHPYAGILLPNMPPMLLTILTLAVPSQHASDTPHHPSPPGCHRGSYGRKRA
ncbi:hypothetical protein O181_115982 [Austropuccinia psidii MF-1]|uniref:Uncharacterized protein n=1 Tax=Austropuccinia psidii MF-1 TaxID=1389203 RepID=A0A9Q3K8I5_9BASI|nr:hypothetical protein [Austropuccinia psidii MF-1]